MAQQGDRVSISPKWTRPDEVMKVHRLKMKKRQLQNRMMKRMEAPKLNLSNDSSDLSQPSSIEPITYLLNLDDSLTDAKRKNPFRCARQKRVKNQEPADIENPSDDNTLFNLLNMGHAMKEQNQAPTSFTCILSQMNRENQQEVEEPKKGKTYLPIDWTLKTKLRFTSSKPFAWNQKLRTCEEASGITGFVRCLGSDCENERWLDTSPNARFHQCCLLWQHPSLPWLTLFPRSAGRVSDTNAIVSDQRTRDALYREFTESFRSLFQLVRARQCPYFYVCANAFTCLFRAAGICGRSDVQAFLTPTTRGFRQQLKEEDVIFTMPLKKSRGRLSGDSGIDSTADSLEDTTTSQTPEEEVGELDDDDGDEGDDWLEKMGVAAHVVKRFNNSQAKLVFDREREGDRTPESLVYVEGIEAQALFNFLLNCKSIVTLSGTLAGVTPTLLSPVAFHGATLKPLKVRQSLVRVESENYHSIELRGPILPHTIHNLCGLLEDSLEEFSATFVNLESTRAFSLAANAPPPPPTPTAAGPAPVPSAFNKENLSDCGLEAKVLESFCSPDASRVQVVDSIKLNADNTYTWS